MAANGRGRNAGWCRGPCDPRLVAAPHIPVPRTGSDPRDHDPTTHEEGTGPGPAPRSPRSASTTPGGSPSPIPDLSDVNLVAQLTETHKGTSLSRMVTG